MFQQYRRGRLEALLKGSSFNLFSEGCNTMVAGADLHTPQAQQFHENHQASCQLAGHLCATSVLISNSVEVSIATIPCPGG